MTTITRLQPFRGFSALQDQVNRFFNESVQQSGRRIRPDDLGAGGRHLSRHRMNSW